MLEDHCLDALSGGVILHHGVDHLAVLIDGHDRQTQHLLADGQTAGLGGVQGAELHLVTVLLGILVYIGHQRSAGHAAVAVKVHENRCKNHKDQRCAENTEIKEKSEIFPETGFKTSNKQRKNHLQIQLLQGGKGGFQGQNYCKEKRNSRNYGESREENS